MNVKKPPRNRDATRERILAAAFAEFAAYGIAGGRVDRIAAQAGCNKNNIYIYFNSKEALFNTVLTQHLEQVHAGLPFTPDDLPGFALRVFDFAMANPQTMRLIAWSSLEQPTSPTLQRAAMRRIKAPELGDTHKDLPVPPEFVMTCTMALATAWSAASCFAAAVGPVDAQDRDHVRQHLGPTIARLIGQKI